jgi:hypothetical protein
MPPRRQQVKLPFTGERLKNKPVSPPPMEIPKRLTRAGAAHAGVVVAANFATPPDMKRKSKVSKSSKTTQSKTSSAKLTEALLAAVSSNEPSKDDEYFLSPLGTPDHQSTPLHFGGEGDVSEMGVADTPTPAPTRHAWPYKKTNNPWFGGMFQSADDPSMLLCFWPPFVFVQLTNYT